MCLGRTERMGPNAWQQADLFMRTRQWVSDLGVLDTQWQRRGAYGIKKQQSETAWGGKENPLGARSGDTVCNKTKQRGFEDVSGKRIRHSNTQCKNNQRVLGIAPRLNRVIPCVEGLKERANNAGQQDQCDGYSRRAGSHGCEYSVSG
jgi:hypothetical protein